MPKAGPRRHNAGVRYLILFIVLLGLGAGGWWLTRPKPVTVTLHIYMTAHQVVHIYGSTSISKRRNRLPRPV